MSKNRLYQVILSPRVTEKSTHVGEDSNQYVFHVVNDASKSEVKGAVEMLFDVNVESVRIVNVNDFVWCQGLVRQSLPQTVGRLCNHARDNDGDSGR